MNNDYLVSCQAVINIKTVFDSDVDADTVKYCLMEDLNAGKAWDFDMDDIEIINFTAYSRDNDNMLKLAKLKALVKQLQWDGVSSWGMEESGCICCGKMKHEGHDQDCKLKKLLE